MSAHGNRFKDEFTESDLNIVNLGYWDPTAEEPGTESQNSEEPGTEETQKLDAEEPVAEEPSAGASGTKKPVRKRTKTGTTRPKQQAVAAEVDTEFSRIERIPGGTKAAIEAILAVAEVPVSVRELSAALIINERAVEAALDELRREYDGDTVGYGDNSPAREPRGYELRQVGGGWRLYSRADFSPWVARFVTRTQSATLSKSAYETLAVIAYRQPVTRTRIAAIRGVNADAAVRQLVHRQLVREAGKEEGTGAALYETTELLLTKLGLNSLDELPPLAPLLPDDAEAALLADTP